MNGIEHHNIVELAVGCLPVWAARTWAPLKTDVLGCCMLPDQKANLLTRTDGSTDKLAYAVWVNPRLDG